VISKIPQKTSWDLDSNIRYAQTAENVGFEYALTQIRFTASYGAARESIPSIRRSTFRPVTDIPLRPT
jgi:hypothetical protein